MFWTKISRKWSCVVLVGYFSCEGELAIWIFQFDFDLLSRIEIVNPFNSKRQEYFNGWRIVKKSMHK